MFVVTFQDSATPGINSANPYAAPGVPVEPPESAQSASCRWLRRIAILQSAGLVVSVAGAVWDVETVIGTGPAYVIIGIVTWIRGRTCPHVRRLSAWFGLSGLVIASVCFSLIVFNDWSPSDAQLPISAIVAFYALVSLPLGLATIFRTPHTPPHEFESHDQHVDENIWD